MKHEESGKFLNESIHLNLPNLIPQLVPVVVIFMRRSGLVWFAAQQRHHGGIYLADSGVTHEHVMVSTSPIRNISTVGIKYHRETDLGNWLEHIIEAIR